MSTRSLSIACAVLTLLVYFKLGPVLADDDKDDNLGQPDLVVELRLEPLKDYLDYDGSRLSPAEVVKVMCKRARAGSRFRYEDLWYHDGRAIGCKRYRQIGTTGGETIMVSVTRDSALSGSRPAEDIANAIVRIMVDLTVNSAGVSAIVLPQSMFNQVVDSLGSFGFYRKEARPETAIPSQISLHCISDPPGEQTDVYYFGK